MRGELSLPWKRRLAAATGLALVIAAPAHAAHNNPVRTATAIASVHVTGPTSPTVTAGTTGKVTGVGSGTTSKVVGTHASSPQAPAIISFNIGGPSTYSLQISGFTLSPSTDTISTVVYSVNNAADVSVPGTAFAVNNTVTSATTVTVNIGATIANIRNNETPTFTPVFTLSFN